MIYNAERGDISIAVGGDAMITRRMSAFNEPNFLNLIDILKKADVSVVNLEMLFHDYENSWQWTDTTYTRSDPRNLADLKWMGVDAVTTANNHSFDFSEGGFLTTLSHCKDFDLPAAGGGLDIDQARAPVYVDSANGRVAVMSATSTFSELSRAGAGRPDFPGRPGVNALRHDVVHYVERDVFEALHKANQELGYEGLATAKREFGFRGNETPIDPSSQVDFLDNRFVLGEEFGVRTSVNESDMSGIGNWIRLTPPEFLVDFAHWTIDQGCALFAGHGPHLLRGIEIYKGMPIFYSLGNFIFQNESVLRLPDEAYRRFGLGYDQTPGDYLDTRSGSGTRAFAGNPVFWQSVVAVCNYNAGKLKEIVLHPIDLGYGRPIPQRGRPVLADGDVAKEILIWLKDASEPFGTKVDIEDSKGYIRL